MNKIHPVFCKNKLPGAQRDIDVIDDDDGHGAAILSRKSQVKLKPDEL